MSKHRPHNPDHAESDPLKWRRIIDMYLQGRGFLAISQETGYSLATVQDIIRRQIPTNYTRNGEREPALEKMRLIVSSLDRKRTLTPREERYALRLFRAKRNPGDCCMILWTTWDRINHLGKNAVAHNTPKSRGFGFT